MSDNKANCHTNIIEDAPLFAGLEDSLWHKKAAVTPKAVRQMKTKSDRNNNSAEPGSDNVKKTRKAGASAGKMHQREPVADKKQKTLKGSGGQIVAGKPPGGKSELLLSVADMCELLGVSRATLVRMDSGGKIPGRMKLGGSVRYHRAVVENWLLELAGVSE